VLDGRSEPERLEDLYEEPDDSNVKPLRAPADVRIAA
jgi:hypothetical protein